MKRIAQRSATCIYYDYVRAGLPLRDDNAGDMFAKMICDAHRTGRVELLPAHAVVRCPRLLLCDTYNNAQTKEC